MAVASGYCRQSRAFTFSLIASARRVLVEGETMESPDEYQKLVNRMYSPRVVIDNGVSSTATLVKVDSARKHGILLEAVQVLVDLDLSINKAYISSDARWFMDVFHVTDRHGAKLTDPSLIAYIEQSLGATDSAPPPAELLTVLELTGTDRLGLLSEIFAVLSDHKFSVADAKVWTHNGRIAALIFLEKSESDECRIQIHRIEARLHNVLRRESDARGASINISHSSVAAADRRLHQMMFADRDYERVSSSSAASSSVTVQNWMKRGYTIVNVQCRNRPKLLFDVVCTLKDMEYVVFHGTIDTDEDRAWQEFYIRHSDGTPINSEAERQRVIQCLQAAIERRASEGLKLELCAVDRRGLLADVTRTFRENGLSITRAEISTKNGAAVNVFFVTDARGHPADPNTIDAVVERVGAEFIKVKRQALLRAGKKDQPASGGAAAFNLGSLVKRNLYNLGLIRSCS